MILLGGSLKQMDDAEMIKITRSEDEILIQAYSAEMTLLKERAFSSGSGKCRNGFLKMDVPKTEKFESREGVLAFEWEGHRLAKSGDGALILALESGGVGWAVVVPMAKSDRIWMRFPAASPFNR